VGTDGEARDGARHVTVAAVQATPMFLDRAGTVDKACSLIAEAAETGARLVVFPETFIPAYPDWVWRLPAWHDGPFIQRLYDEAVRIPGPDVARLGAAARKAGVFVAMGCTEIDGGSLYNSLLYLGPDGRLLGRHRKLMPTGGERTVWGYGDGSTLDVIPTPFGNVGGLICWENYMPLARAALYARGVDIFLAPTWDNDEVWIATLQHIAKEGRVFVIGVSPVLRGADVPAELRGEIYSDGPDDWMSRGHGTIVAPGGEILAGPVRDKEAIVTATLDLAELARHRRMFDPVGHYARPDVFTLTVDARPRRSVRFEEPSD
jgi:nitrilase